MKDDNGGTGVPVQKEERIFDIGGGYTATVSRIGRSRLGPILSIYGMNSDAAAMASMDMVFRAGVAGKIVDKTGRTLPSERHPIAGLILQAEAFDKLAMEADVAAIAECSAFLMTGLTREQKGN